MKYIALFLSVLFGLLAFVFTFAYLESFFGIIESDTIPIVLYDTIEYEDAFWKLMGQDVGAAIFAILSILLCAFFMSMYHRHKKKRKPMIDKENVELPYILYLRSFVDDKITLRNISSISDSRSEEEVMVDVLSEIAPVYAIGDPKDKKMPVGATRLYVDDEHWKSTVEYMAERAELVVLRLGKTSSFWWEVEMALQKIDRQKLLFIVPCSRSFNNVSVLFKMLLEHGVDISELNISIDKKARGSISSFVYFDKNNKPQTTEVNVPRFTKLVFSYADILKNSLSVFFSYYGLISKNRPKVRMSRIIQLGIILWLVFVCFSRTFKDFADLRYQMPYELVEECVKYPEFVDKYSNETDGENVVHSYQEAIKGDCILDDEDYLAIFESEAYALMTMSDDEFAQLDPNEPKQIMLMVKKYSSNYPEYVQALTKAAIFSIRYESEVESIKNIYQSRIEEVPQWLYDACDVFDDSELNHREAVRKFYQLLDSHRDEENYVEVLKIFRSIE